MNAKYKPGIYFGISILIFNLVILKVMHPEAFSKQNWVSMVISLVIGSIIGGTVFAITWNWVKKRQNQDH